MDFWRELLEFTSFLCITGNRIYSHSSGVAGSTFLLIFSRAPDCLLRVDLCIIS